ncbi:hypothetical protein BGX29_008789 [Mortierella sp. GBA35]|nr:hypothetical protein BGX29_008789 [Mortierella sp. GBA35]
MWPLELLKQVRTSAGLRRLTWNVEHLGLPMELLVEAMAEGSWPELCELGICAPYGPNDELDENLTKILRALTSGRLTYFALSDGILGPLTLGCLRELYFGHVQELDFGRSAGVPSEMVQEILAGCVHLIKVSAPHIFVRDIATASKSWTCLGLRQLVVFIAKQPDDEDGWDSRVFEQISRLRQLEILNLQRDPYLSVFIGEPRPDEILRLGTLDLRLPARSASEELSNNNGDIICWSSLVRLRQFSFDRDRQTLGMEEVRWMLEHWRHLHSIEGNFKGVDGDGRGGPDDLFRQKDIHFIN